MGATTYPRPRSNSFVKRVMPYLDKERELKKDISNIHMMQCHYNEAIEVSSLARGSLVRSALLVFNSWSSSVLRAVEAELNNILQKVEDVCIGFTDDD